MKRSLPFLLSFGVFFPCIIAQNSCSGKCGKWSENCWCNANCGYYKNCCSDYESVCKPAPDSCKGNCGRWAANCWCNDGCESHGNCCSDYESVCKGPSPGPSPPPSSNAALKVLLPESKYPEAKCLDGSQSGYYLRKGSENKYLLFFEGGGWCYDSSCNPPTKEGTLKDCKSRSEGRLGSSKTWPAEQDSYLTGMLNADPDKNPVFHNWTLVYMPYCDGTSWSGDAVVNGLFFKGKKILDAILSELISSTAVRNSTQVVVSGGSAGASAVYYHADMIAATLQPLSGEVLALPDAGFFLNLRDKDNIDCWPSQMRSVWELSKGYNALHHGCLTRFPTEQWKCLFPEYYADLITTRTLALNSMYDSSEISYTLRLNCSAIGSWRSPKCTGPQLKLFTSMRDQHIQAWAALAKKRGSGVWAPSCIDHTMSWAKWTDTKWEVPALSGNTMASVVQRWLAFPQDMADYEDAVAWPKNTPCAGLDSVSAQKLVDIIYA